MRARPHYSGPAISCSDAVIDRTTSCDSPAPARLPDGRTSQVRCAGHRVQFPPAFPPHTSSTTARNPGLLHLAFKHHHDHRTDYVITDAPGEWFRKWAVERDAPDAEGARWAAEHADAFVLVVDREALAGPHMGAARSGIQLLARRLADELRGRPVALVWTKSDVSISDAMEEAVRSAVLKLMPKAPEFAVTIMPNPDETENVQGFLDLLRWVLNIRRPTVRLPEPAADNPDPLFRIGVR